MCRDRARLPSYGLHLPRIQSTPGLIPAARNNETQHLATEHSGVSTSLKKAYQFQD